MELNSSEYNEATGELQYIADEFAVNLKLCSETEYSVKMLDEKSFIIDFTKGVQAIACVSHDGEDGTELFFAFLRAGYPESNLQIFTDYLGQVVTAKQSALPMILDYDEAYLCPLNGTNAVVKMYPEAMCSKTETTIELENGEYVSCRQIYPLYEDEADWLNYKGAEREEFDSYGWSSDDFKDHNAFYDYTTYYFAQELVCLNCPKSRHILPTYPSPSGTLQSRLARLHGNTYIDWCKLEDEYLTKNEDIDIFEENIIALQYYDATYGFLSETADAEYDDRYDAFFGIDGLAIRKNNREKLLEKVDNWHKEHGCSEYWMKMFPDYKG